MRRFIKIIIAILLIIAIILVIAWFRARHAAQQQGTAAPSFREFLGLGSVTPSQQTTTPGTGLSSDFTQSNDSGTTSDNSVTGGTSGTATSQFTSGAFSPTQSTGLGTTKLSSSGSNSTSLSGGSPLGGSGNSGTSGNPAPAPAGGTVPVSQCSADITIQFTPDEISRLNALQNRFYAIAGNLHTDADVQTEVSNHDMFKAKADQITELYNYCVAESPKITNPLYTTRITTPFYRDENRDVDSGYVTGVNKLFSGNSGNKQIDNFVNATEQDPRNVPTAQRVIERIFRLNLW